RPGPDSMCPAARARGRGQAFLKRGGHRRGSMRHITVQTGDPADAEARRLIEQLDGYLARLYPPQSNHLLSVEALRGPGVVFLLARVDGMAAGCGAFVARGGEYAEGKRTFVLPAFRGLRVGGRLPGALEARARGAGLGTG